MRSPSTGSEQDVLLDGLLVCARAEARFFARQAALLVQLNDLVGREETELSRLAQFPVLECAGTLRLGQQVSSRSAQAQRLTGTLPCNFAALTSGELLVGQVKALLAVTSNAAPTGGFPGGAGVVAGDARLVRPGGAPQSRRDGAAGRPGRPHGPPG